MAMTMTDKIIGAIGIVVITIMLIALTPTIVDAVQINTTNWTFTGHEGAEQLLGLVPFVWIAGILVSATVGMFVLAKQPTNASL